MPTAHSLHHLSLLLSVAVLGACGGPLRQMQPNIANGGAWSLLHDGFRNFVRVARAKKLDRYVGSGWHSSGTKVIDNAIVGFGVYCGLVKKGLSRRLARLGLVSRNNRQVRRTV